MTWVRIVLFRVWPFESSGRHAATACDACALEATLVFSVIGSSDEVHVVDALAITGDEGRGSLRKAAGSRQTGFDPQMSEWGNPPLHR